MGLFIAMETFICRCKGKIVTPERANMGLFIAMETFICRCKGKIVTPERAKGSQRYIISCWRVTTKTRLSEN